MAMVVTGKKYRGGKGYIIIKAGGKFIIPVVEQYHFLPLGIIKRTISVTDVKTREKARVNLQLEIMFKIGSDPESLSNAAEQLLDKTEKEIAEITTDVVKGWAITTIKNFPVDEIEAVSEDFVKNIMFGAAKDLSNVGIEVRSVVVKDVEIIAKTEPDVTDMDLLRRQLKNALTKLEQVERRLDDIERKMG
jgi:flotillin